MAAVLSCSPISRSPLRGVRSESCDRVPTEELYADAQAHVVQWRKDFLASAGFEAHQGIRELCHDREQLKDLQADLSSVQSLVQVASQLQAGGGRLAEVLQSSSALGTARSQAVARLTDDLRQSCVRCKQELQQGEYSTVQQRALSNAQHAEALKLFAIYEDRLGLMIRREAFQTVRMAFSLVDEADLDKEFWFTLRLGVSDEDAVKGYCVPTCTPYVPELAQLLAELNANSCSTAALPRFVCSMRKCFLKLSKESPKP
jgi:hypothetical protein